MLAVDDPRHGTANGYSNLGCRCDACRTAHTEYITPRVRAWRERNPDKMREYSGRRDRKKVNAATRRCHDKNRALLAEAKAGGCVDCGGEAEDMHHLDPNSKDFRVSMVTSYGIERFKAELAKCVPLCKPCHRARHGA